MDWIRENWFWLVVGAFFFWMHTMHGGHGGHGGHGSHGGHAGHGGRPDPRGHDQSPTDAGPSGEKEGTHAAH